MPKRAAILGLDTALGAYLARLLGARGYAVTGTGGTTLLARLGIASDVFLANSIDEAADCADEVYDLRYVNDLPLTAASLIVAVDPADTDRRMMLAAERLAGRRVATAVVFPQESRLGPGTTPVARIVAAAAGGSQPVAVDLATSIDCGWTAEYVDALSRLVQHSAAEVAIATGRLITGNDIARVAAAFFGRRPPLPVPAVEASAGDTAIARRLLAWRSITFGDELIKVLCEGAAYPA